MLAKLFPPTYATNHQIDSMHMENTEADSTILHNAAASTTTTKKKSEECLCKE